jgi:uncharacterized membrane protein YkoI
MTENNITPTSAPDAAGVATSPASDAPARAPKRTRTRTLLLAGGAVAAAAVLAGGGVAIGAAIADEGDDRDDDVALVADDSSSDDSSSDDSGSSRGETAGTADAGELSDIVQTAAGAGDDLGAATSIEAVRSGGWEVRFETESGDETTVLVGVDGAARVTGTETGDADDSAPAGTLDTATVRSLVDAALAEADGTIIDLDIDGDAAAPYDVTVLLADRTSVDIELGADFAVLRTDVDD